MTETSGKGSKPFTWPQQYLDQFEREIQWLKDRLDIVGPRQRKEYEHQIRHKEITIALHRREP